MLSNKLKIIAALLAVIVISGTVGALSVTHFKSAKAAPDPSYDSDGDEDGSPQQANNTQSTRSGSNAAGLPTCNSKQATGMLKDSIENGAYKNIAKVQLLDWDKLAEIVYDEKNGKRECIGDVVLNTGKETIHYTLSQAKSDPSKILIQVEELSASQADQGRKMAALNAMTPEQKQANKMMADCYSQVGAKYGIPLNQAYLQCSSGSDSECGSAMASVCNATGQGIECGAELTACNRKSGSAAVSEAAQRLQQEQQQQQQNAATAAQNAASAQKSLFDCQNKVEAKRQAGLCGEDACSGEFDACARSPAANACLDRLKEKVQSQDDYNSAYMSCLNQ